MNAADWAGFTALHRAAFNGHLDCVTALLEAGALPNSRDTVGGRTPMHQAAGKRPFFRPVRALPSAHPRIPSGMCVEIFLVGQSTSIHRHRSAARSAGARSDRAKASGARRRPPHHRPSLRAAGPQRSELRTCGCAWRSHLAQTHTLTHKHAHARTRTRTPAFLTASPGQAEPGDLP